MFVMLTFLMADLRKSRPRKSIEAPLVVENEHSLW